MYSLVVTIIIVNEQCRFKNIVGYEFPPAFIICACMWLSEGIVRGSARLAKLMLEPKTVFT